MMQRGSAACFSLRTRRGAAKGAILSRERMAPFRSPKRTRGEFPSTPDIGSLDLEELHALRNVSAVYMASPPKVCVLRRRHHM